MPLVQVPFDKKVHSRLKKVSSAYGTPMTTYIRMAVSKKLLEDQAVLMRLTEDDLFTEEELKDFNKLGNFDFWDNEEDDVYEDFYKKIKK